MFKKIEDIDFDWLKANHERIYFFGLGFIQVKINETFRLHFYIKELPSFVDSPHNHRYDFESLILKGHITNNIFKETQGDDFTIQEDSCSEGFIPSKEARKANFKLIDSQTYRTGESYSIGHEEFHTVHASDCITLLKRSEYKKDLADVSYPTQEGKTCPFSSKMNEELLWNFIKKALNQ